MNLTQTASTCMLCCLHACDLFFVAVFTPFPLFLPLPLFTCSIYNRVHMSDRQFKGSSLGQIQCIQHYNILLASFENKFLNTSCTLAHVDMSIQVNLVCTLAKFIGYMQTCEHKIINHRLCSILCEIMFRRHYMQSSRRNWLDM